MLIVVGAVLLFLAKTHVHCVISFARLHRHAAFEEVTLVPCRTPTIPQSRRQGVANAKPAMRAAQSKVVSPRQQTAPQRVQGRGRGRSTQAGGGRVSYTSLRRIMCAGKACLVCFLLRLLVGLVFLFFCRCIVGTIHSKHAVANLRCRC